MIHQLEAGMVLRSFKLYQLLPCEQSHARSDRSLREEESDLTAQYTGEGIRNFALQVIK